MWIASRPRRSCAMTIRRTRAAWALGTATIVKAWYPAPCGL